MQKKAILCVDDELLILNSLKSQLQKMFGDDYFLEFAEEPEEALEIIEELVGDQIRIVVIVSDWLMPGMKGDEFLVKVHQKYPGIVKIMLTGQADEQAIKYAKEKAQLFCCLSKPWSEAELYEKLCAGLKLLE